VPDRSSHPDGAFSWIDLTTPDLEGAKAFYTALFGWETEALPMPEGMGAYVMCRRRGRDAAAMSQSTEQPPHWNSYVTVESVDATAERAAGLGGTLLAPPFDVMDVGRMAVVQDPTGAVVCLWEARGHIGAGVVNEHGSLTWNDLATRDPEAAERFYSELLGWRFERIPESPIAYWTIYNGDRSNGGMRTMEQYPEEAPPHWLPYLAVDDLDAAMDSARGLVGRVDAGPLEVPAGRFALLTDPQGAAFALFAGEFDD